MGNKSTFIILFTIVAVFLMSAYFTFFSASASYEPNWEEKWEKMEYNEIPGTVFDKLTPSLQYKIKYKHTNDSILGFEYSRLDTVYFEDGTFNKEITVKDTFYLYLKTDSLIYRPFGTSKSTPNISFKTNEDYYNKKEKRFTNSFEIDFKYSKKNKYYYVLKTDFPILDTTTYQGRYVDYISFNLSKKPYFYTTFTNGFDFSETHKIYKGSLGTFNGKPWPEKDLLILEENQRTKFVKWLTNCNSIKNIHTDTNY